MIAGQSYNWQKKENFDLLREYNILSLDDNPIIIRGFFPSSLSKRDNFQLVNLVILYHLSNQVISLFDLILVILISCCYT